MLPDAKVRRVLIYRLGSLGDTVVALPCLHLIARAFPHAERRLLTNQPVNSGAPDAESLLSGTGLVHGYMRYRVGTRNPLALLRLALAIRRFRPQVLVYLMPPRPSKALRRDKAFFRIAGARHCIGLSDERPTAPRFDAATGLYEAEAARLSRTIAELGDARLDDPASWDLHLSSDERRFAQGALGEMAWRPLLALAPGTKMQSKDWGRDNWRALLAKMSAAYPGFALVLLGSKDDFPSAALAAQAWRGPVVNLCGLSPRPMAAVLAHATLFLGPDSGPMHIAAAAGVPCVIAFSASQLPGVWFPHGPDHQVVYHRTSCAGCRLETCAAEGRRCLTSISVNEMLAAAMRAARQIQWTDDGSSSITAD